MFRIVRFQLEIVFVVFAGASVSFVVDAARLDAVEFVVFRRAVAVRRVAVAGVSRVADRDAGSAVETIFQGITDESKRGQSHPAGSDGARTGHSVALAFLAHLRLDVLEQNNKRSGLRASVTLLVMGGPGRPATS